MVMKIKTSVLILLCLALTGKLQAFEADTAGGSQLPGPFRVLPTPRKVEILPGGGLSPEQLRTVVAGEGVTRPVMGAFLNPLPYGAFEEDGALTLKLSTASNIPESVEGYILTVQGGSASVEARDQAGLFYGCQTLEQLLEDSRAACAPVPACRITDYPEMSYRAVQIDVKHHLDNMNTYYESIDRLARYKINAVVFEFEDKLRYRRQPLVGAPQAISIEEMAALTRYARKRNIEITPLVQGLGHASYILKHQQYAHLRELEDNLSLIHI